MSIKPGVIITVLYKRTPDLKFDLSYYLSHHIPLATKFWEPHGIIDATTAEPTPDSEYAYAITIQWKDMAGWEAASKDKEAMKTIMNDVPNFTNGQPIFIVSKVVR